MFGNKSNRDSHLVVDALIGPQVVILTRDLCEPVLFAGAFVALADVAAGFFLKHLVFFFVAVGVALINWGAVFYDYGLVLLVAILVSSILPFYVVGILMQKFMKEKN